ncbi:hypothetical protein SEUCBS140593_009872 [Sporothrix eucalyptigena]|uniref:C2H2-type domain-containing protein n=1 Tax=Sporothrix eucalyptigena TaxID=1812306 RepID=A0ABP0CYH8_9PEZI
MANSSFHMFRALPSGKTNHGAHTCPTCFKTFTRSEHCARHQFSHNKERPFPCRFCGKTYARKDLVKRHERTLHAEEYTKLMEANDARSGASNNDDDDPSSNVSNRTKPSPRQENAQPTPPDSISVAVPVSNHRRSAPHDQIVVLGSNPRKRPRDEAAAGDDVASNPAPKVSLRTSLAIMENPDAALEEMLHENNSLVQLKSSELLTNFQGHLLEPPQMVGIDVDTEPTAQIVAAALSSSGAGPAHETRPNASFNALHAGDLPVSDHMAFIQALNLLGSECTSTGDEFHYRPNSGMPQDGIDFPWWQANFEPLDAGHHPMSGQQVFRSRSESVPSLDSSGQPARSVSSADTSGRLPRILKETPTSPLQLLIDDNAYRCLQLDTCSRLGQPDYALPLKNCRDLQQMLNSYIDGFHRHCPILHIASMKPDKTPSPLVWAMCCIGSLYRLDREKAQRLHEVASSMLPSKVRRCKLSASPQAAQSTHAGRGQAEKEPADDAEMEQLWVLQTRVLLCFYASLGASHNDDFSEFNELGLIAREYRLRRDYLRHSRLLRHHTWGEWIERESIKRLLCSIFIESNLFLILYDYVPGFDTSQDLDIEVLEEERLWSAPTAASWEAARQTVIPCTRRIRDVVADMLAGAPGGGDDAPEPYYVSAFTTLVAVHAVNVHNWHVSQVSQTLARGTRTPGCTPDAMLQHSLDALARCHEVLRLSRRDGVEPMWDDPEGPLLFNCEAMLRGAYARLFSDVSLPQRFTILCGSSRDRQAALREFVAAKQERSALVTSAVAHIFEAILVPIKIGHLLVRKTAAFSWSIETAISAWGSSVVLCKWIYCIETLQPQKHPTELEFRIMDQVKTAIEDMDGEYEEGHSLAAALIRALASFLTDVA